MAQRYFEKLPVITYANTTAVDITARAVVLNSIYNNASLYYPYDVQQYERPDNIADRYYNDQYKDWIIRLTNKLIDPYHDWYLDQNTFNAYIAKKYGSIANAQTKIKHYQNNWYTNADSISTAAYNALPVDAKRFWEPVEINGQNVSTPSEYRRVKQDWTITTNQIVQYNTSNAVGFIIDEVVDVTINSLNAGRGQVLFANTTHLMLQHAVGSITSNTVGTCVVSGRESANSTTFTASTLLADNITADESIYWAPITYFQYESDINERNKSILVLNAGFTDQVSRQLKDLMSDR